MTLAAELSKATGAFKALHPGARYALEFCNIENGQRRYLAAKVPVASKSEARCLAELQGATPWTF